MLTFKSVYMGIFYDFLIAQVQLLLMSAVNQQYRAFNGVST